MIKKITLTTILTMSLVLRLWLTPKEFHVDMLSNAAWGEWIYHGGAKTFYEHGLWYYSWPTQPPLISLVYGFDKYLHIQLLGQIARVNYWSEKYKLPGDWTWLREFVQWFAYGTVNIFIPFQIGYLVSMKLLPITADLVIAGILWYLDPRRRMRWPTLYLISPFSWYLSSLWGQYDQVAFLPIWLAFLTLSSKWGKIFSPGLFVTGIMLKPTGLIFLIIYGVVYALKRPRWWQLVCGLAICWVVVYSTTRPFTERAVNDYWRNTLIEKIFLKSEPRISTNAFNFWRIIIGDRAMNQASKIGPVSARSWGWAVLVLINLAAIKLFYQHRNLQALSEALFVVGAGSWLFGVGMVERYYFAGVVTGLAVCIWRPNLLKYWLGLAIIYFVNLYNGWWFPGELGIRGVLEWNGAISTRLLAVVNVGMYLLMTRKLFAKK